MNKKTKSFAVGLVAVLCFLLVFAIGFGVTGAWYQAQRRASGTVKMNQGIYLKFTNLQTLNDKHDLTNKMGGQLLKEDGNALTDLSVVPAQLVTIKNPTLTAADNSVPFYARVKVTYTAKYFADANREDLDEVTGAVAISPETMTQLFGAAGQLQRGAGWVDGGDGYWYYGADTKVLTKMVAGEEGHPLFRDGNLQFADWTAANSTAEPENLVEAGGPKQDGKEIGQVIVTVDIEVIQAQNMTNEALAAANWTGVTVA